MHKKNFQMFFFHILQKRKTNWTKSPKEKPFLVRLHWISFWFFFLLELLLRWSSTRSNRFDIFSIEIGQTTKGITKIERNRERKWRAVEHLSNLNVYQYYSNANETPRNRKVFRISFFFPFPFRRAIRSSCYQCVCVHDIQRLSRWIRIASRIHFCPYPFSFCRFYFHSLVFHIFILFCQRGNNSNWIFPEKTLHRNGTEREKNKNDITAQRKLRVYGKKWKMPWKRLQ